MDLDVKIIDLPIAPEFLWLVLALLIIFFIIIASVLTYHWRVYGLDHNPKVFAKSIFWIVSLLLIFAMTFAVMTFEYL